MLEIPNRDRRSERREATKAEILEVAWDLCREHGLAGLSLRDIAKRVGMQAPSLYSYFASKHDIYDAMFAQGMREFDAGQPDYPAEVSTRDGIGMMARYFAKFCTDDPVRYQLLFQRTIPGFEPSPESYAVSVGNLERGRAWFASRGIEHSLDMYTAVLTGLVDQQISNDPGGDRWLRLVDDSVDMFLVYAEQSKPKKGARK